MREEKPVFESEFDLLYWMLQSKRANPQESLYQQVKTSALDDQQASFSKEYMGLINGLEAEEKLGNLDLGIAKDFFADEVIQHAAVGVGRNGFGFRMTRSKFAESVENVYKNESFMDPETSQGRGKKSILESLPRPNPKAGGGSINKNMYKGLGSKQRRF